MTGPGRPRIHFDDAARSAAYRERRSARLDDGDIALRQFNNPSINFIGRCARMAVGASDRPEEAAQRILAAVIKGLAAAGVQVNLDPQADFVTPRKGKSNDPE
jgi:hypothetical protein